MNKSISVPLFALFIIIAGNSFAREGKSQQTPSVPDAQASFKVGQLYRIDYANQDEISGFVKFPTRLQVKNGNEKMGWKVTLLGDNSSSPSLPDQITVTLNQQAGPTTWEGVSHVSFSSEEGANCNFDLTFSLSFIIEEGYNPEQPYPPMNHSYAIATTQVPRGFNVLSDGTCVQAGVKTHLGTIDLNWTPIHNR